MTSRRRNQPSRKPESEDISNVSLTEEKEDTFVVEEVPESEVAREEITLISIPDPEPTSEPKIEPVTPAKEKPPKRAERIRQPRNVPKFSTLKGH